ncbi:MAG: hypothetical protein PHS97_02620 [Oscillospiraceae bacterium]|nr:hypothetical protein [Oscillospiraceae bacterium]
MNGKDLLIGASYVEEELLVNLDGIKHKKSRKPLFSMIAAVAAVFAVVVTLPHFTGSPPVAPITMVNPVADAPMGMRKIMNYNGFRYAFLENGSTYKVDAENIGAELGVLEHSIAANPEANGKKDFFASFAIGGTVLELKSYDKSFRVAVAFEGNTYLAQRVDSVNNEDILLSEYFETADFGNTVESISVYSHFGDSVLDELTKKKDIKTMIELLADSVPAKLSHEQFEEIGKAQSSGKSFMLSFNLNDSTEFQFYLIPSLNLVMVGDNRYALCDNWQTEYSDFFASLEVPQAIPQQ